MLLKTRCRGHKSSNSKWRLRFLWAGCCPTTRAVLGDRPQVFGHEAYDTDMGPAWGAGWPHHDQADELVLSAE